MKSQEGKSGVTDGQRNCHAMTGAVRQSDDYTYCLTYTNFFFAVFFTIEAVLKIIAYGK